MFEQREAGDLVLIREELEAEAAVSKVLGDIQTQGLVDGLAEPFGGREDGVMEGGEGSQKTDTHGNLERKTTTHESGDRSGNANRGSGTIP